MCAEFCHDSFRFRAPKSQDYDDVQHMHYLISFWTFLPCAISSYVAASVTTLTHQRMYVP